MPDKDALQSMYLHCRRRLIGMATKALPCETDAEDVFQDAFTQFFLRDLSNLSEKEAEYYLIRCVSNAVVDWWRNDKRRMKTDAGDLDLYPDKEKNPREHLSMDEDLKMIWKAAANLPPRQHQAVLLHYFGQHPIQTIAEIMDCNPSTVRSLLHNAVQYLRTQFQESFAGKECIHHE